jgi:hypothetical protein
MDMSDDWHHREDAVKASELAHQRDRNIFRDGWEAARRADISNGKKAVNEQETWERLRDKGFTPEQATKALGCIAYIFPQVA